MCHSSGICNVIVLVSRLGTGFCDSMTDHGVWFIRFAEAAWLANRSSRSSGRNDTVLQYIKHDN